MNLRASIYGKKIPLHNKSPFVFVIPAVVAGWFVMQNISTNHLLAFVVLLTAIGSIWDIWATKHGNRDPIWLWQFNHKETLGIKILGLPIEEYLFYVASSVYVVFMWEAIKVALATGSILFYILIPTLTLWTLVCILVPYNFGHKDDRLAG